MLSNHSITLKNYEKASLYLGGVLVVLVLIACVFIKISGAIVSNGVLVSEGRNRILQHPDGGRVSEVLVRDGDLVEAGEFLIKLDGQELAAEEQRLERAKLELEVRIARLSASLEGETGFTLSSLRGRVGQVTPEDEIANVQKAVLFAERAKLDTELKQAVTRATGAETSQKVLKRQRETNLEKLKLIDSEIISLQSLVEDKLVPQSRMTQLQREKLDIQQRVEAIDLEMTQLKNSVKDSHLTASFIQKNFNDRVWREKEAAERELADISLQVDRIKGQLGRLDIVAPIDGRIHEIAVTNAGSFIRAGDVALQIVPEGAERQVKVRIAADDIDDVYLGQSARLRFDTYRHLKMPEFDGEIAMVSADRTIDPNTGQAYFSVSVKVAAESMVRFNQMNAETGVPVTVLILTQSRSLADYLMSPLKNSFGQMFREN